MNYAILKIRIELIDDCLDMNAISSITHEIADDLSNGYTERTSESYEFELEW